MNQIDKNELSSVRLSDFFEKAGLPKLEYLIQQDSEVLYPERIRKSGQSITADFSCGIIEDQLELIHGVYKINRTWKITKPGRWIFHTVIKYEQSQNEIFVPSVMYRCNDMGKGVFPRGGISKDWSFMEDRIPVPSLALLYNKKGVLGFCTEPASELTYLSSVTAQQQNDFALIKISIPGSEYPFVYSGKTNLQETTKAECENYLTLKEVQIPFEYSRSFYIVVNQSSDCTLFGQYRKIIEALEDQWPHDVNIDALPSWDIYYQKKLEHLIYLSETDPITGLSYIKMGKGNGQLQNIYDFTSSSFLVKSLEGAWILSKSDSDGQSVLSELAQRIGQYFLQGEQAPGIHQDNYSLKEDIWGGYLGISEHNEFKDLINARCNGETMIQYLKLYKELLHKGMEVKEFLELPIRVARFYLDNQLSGINEGSFGRWWSKEGEPVNLMGTNGAYIVSFIIELEPYLKDTKELSEKLMKAAHFYASLIDKGDFFGDTLDADAYDKESGVALMTMFLDLYERDQDIKWLVYAQKSAENILTWIWQYNSLFPVGSPLGQRNFQTSGMTSVSVAHHHLDFYGILIAHEFLRYWEHKQDSFYRNIAIRLMDSCRQLLFYDKDLSGKDSDCSGWQPEQINHTNWDYFNREERSKGHYDIDIAWVTVLGLGAYLKIKERYPELLR